MYEIPKELKTDIKLWAVYSSDIPFLLIMLLLTLMLEDFFYGRNLPFKASLLCRERPVHFSVYYQTGPEYFDF